MPCRSLPTTRRRDRPAAARRCQYQPRPRGARAARHAGHGSRPRRRPACTSQPDGPPAARARTAGWASPRLGAVGGEGQRIVDRRTRPGRLPRARGRGELGQQIRCALEAGAPDQRHGAGARRAPPQQRAAGERAVPSTRQRPPRPRPHRGCRDRRSGPARSGRSPRRAPTGRALGPTARRSAAAQPAACRRAASNASSTPI